MKGIIMLKGSIIQQIYCDHVHSYQLLNSKVYNFLDEHGKMITNMIISQYDINNGIEVIIDESNMD